MYNFIDVNEVSDGVVLPSEALKINGEYIEDQIAGYRTLTVQGREALSPDVISQTTGVRDGSFLKSKRYPERIITVQYQLIAESNEAFREAYNKLASILNVKEAELIFNDEQDKFFIGTPCIIGEVKPGTNAVIGEFEVLCTDPFKYSVDTYEARVNEENEVLFNYGGTYKAYPELEAAFYEETEASEDGETAVELTGSGDCGYVAFFNESEKIIQIGNPEEADGENAYPKSQTLANSTFKTSAAWGTAAKAQWAVNKGVVSDPNSLSQTGSLAMALATKKTTSVKGYSGSSRTYTHEVGSSSSDNPHVIYKVEIRTYDRTPNSVKAAVVIHTRLKNSDSWLGHSKSLEGTIRLGSVSKTVNLKLVGTYWHGKGWHSVSIPAFTISGLSADQESLSGLSCSLTVRSIGGSGTAGERSQVSLGVCPIAKYVTSTTTSGEDTYYLAPSSFGTNNGKWHGPSITRTLPADQNGDVGASNFTMTYAQKMSIGSDNKATSQYGGFQVLLTDSNKKVVAGVNVYKGSNGKNAKLRFYINSSVAQTMDIDLSYNNKYFNSNKTSKITKSGQTVTFDICGIKKTFRDPDIATAAVTAFTITMTQFGTRTPLSYNGLYWVKFVKDNCETWKDIPNKFSANDVVVADCKSGNIYLNGVLDHRLGALGNDWEGFCITPGLNQIGTSYSEWVDAEHAPRFTIRYREVFL